MGRLKKVRIYITWVDKRIENADIPVSLLGQVLPSLYSHPAIWRIVYRDRKRVYDTYADFRKVYGGVVLPHVDNIERRRYNVDVEDWVETWDALK